MPPRKYCYWSVWAAVPRLKGLQGPPPSGARPVSCGAWGHRPSGLSPDARRVGGGKRWAQPSRTRRSAVPGGGRGEGGLTVSIWARPRLRPLGPLRPPPPATQACLRGSTGMRRAQGGRAVRGRAPPGPHLRPPSRSISCARDRCHHGRPGGCLCHQQRALGGGTSGWAHSSLNTGAQGAGRPPSGPA